MQAIIIRSVIMAVLAVALTACQTATHTRAALSEEESKLLAQADTALALGERDEAVAGYEQSASLSSGAVRAHLELAALYKELEELDKAQAVLWDAYHLNRNSVDVLKELANLLMRDGQFDQAGQLAQEGLALSPDDVRLLNTKAILQDQQGNHRQAQENYRRALSEAIMPLDKEYTINNLALSLIASGDYQLAVDVLEKHRSKAQKPMVLRHTLALAYGVMGEEDKARELASIDMSDEAVRRNLIFYRQFREGVIDRRSLFGRSAESR